MINPDWHKKSTELQKKLDEIKLDSDKAMNCNCGHRAKPAWRTGFLLNEIPADELPIICIDCAQEQINKMIKLEQKDKDTSIYCSVCDKYISIFMAGFHFFESGCKNKFTDDQYESYKKQFVDATDYVQKLSHELND